MQRRKYYLERTGKVSGTWDLLQVRYLFYELYERLSLEGCFDLLFGTHCLDNDLQTSVGEAGTRPDLFFFHQLRKHGLYPVLDCCCQYSHDELFAVVELLYQYVSVRTDGGKRHEWCGCGGCSAQHDRAAGRVYFRQQINDLFRDYGEGYELSTEGDVVTIAEPGLASILKAPVPNADPEKVEARVSAAIRKFRSGRSSLDDRRDAVASLVGVLEFLRDDVKRVLPKKDDDDLFNIANNFGIRHNTANQRTDYEQKVWLDWMFCYYLSTIHAVLRLIKGYDSGESG